MTFPVIQVENVRKSFKKVKAVRGVNLQVFPGEFVAVLGPNGAGKTTLVEMIEGIQKPDEGTILIKGMPWKGNEKQLNRLLGISLQETWFIEKLTVLETLTLFASFYRLGRNRALEILSMIQIEEKRNVFTKNLSGGQRQRLALGIALINYPEILLLDEPTTGLDPIARLQIWKILMRLKEERNTSLVLTTHYMEEAEFLCDRIVIIDQGKIIASGSLEELLANCGLNEIIEVRFGQEPPLNMALIQGVLDVQFNRKTGLFTLNVSTITQTLPLLIKELEQRNTEILSLQSRKPTLDDLFISLTGRHLNE